MFIETKALQARFLDCHCLSLRDDELLLLLTLNGGDNLTGGHTQEPLARVQALQQGGREAERGGQQAGDHKVQDKQVPGIPMRPLPCQHE